MTRSDSSPITEPETPEVSVTPDAAEAAPVETAAPAAPVVEAQPELHSGVTGGRAVTNDLTLSEALELFLQLPYEDGQRITIGRLFGSIGEQSIYGMIFLFTLPFAIPGFDLDFLLIILGLPLTYLGAHMVVGKRKIWLPKSAEKHEFEMKFVHNVIKTVNIWLNYIEKLFKERLTVLVTGWAERAIGAVFVLLSLSYFFASDTWIARDLIPVTVCTFAFSLCFRDGYANICAWVMLVLCFVFASPEVDYTAFQ